MKIRDQLANAAPPLANHRFDAPLVIYGAGGAGRSVARNLGSRGVKVGAFLDAAASADDVRDGIEAFTLSRWFAEFDPAQHDVLISLHNPFAEVGPVIDQLRASHFRRVLTMVDYVNSIDDPTFRYWLGPADFYRDKGERIEAAFNLLSDSSSREWFESCLNLRLLGDYHGLPRPSFDDQYAPADLPNWRNPMRLVDCGAYEGDSVDWLRGARYEIESLAAFEPDPANYAVLADRCSDLNAALFPCGVSDTSRRVSFSSGMGPSSRVEDANAGDEIQCVAIDQALPGFRPTLIKMDIEGAEPAALRGAERTLRQCRPGLAISIYHEPDHLWEIPLYVASLDLGYRMFLRGHGHNDYDLVLYCLPD